PFRPYAKISGGVLFLAPGQNGHPRGPVTTTLSRTKSIGRLPRSVEMITQRAVIGSFRSSGTTNPPRPRSGTANANAPAHCFDLHSAIFTPRLYPDWARTARARRRIMHFEWVSAALP